ncbi:hypothetical protein GE09DRAFT_627797 [Coniochaeta sp. 2T2.1]|nr:hypothetical protein GE09DRAFT_627797 [Coniochaeta sp. 2T2.1]
MGRVENIKRLTPRAQPQQRRKRAKATIAATLAAVLWISWRLLGAQWAAAEHRGPGRETAVAGGNVFTTDWDLIQPSEDLHWVPCFRLIDEFQCARLTVPLDYNRPLNRTSPLMRPSTKVHIALIMLPGKNHTKSGAWSESPLLVNPGGPGGSGTTLVLLAGRAHQEIAGSDLDIVGFDPRGIGATTPQVDCFSDISTDIDDHPIYQKHASKEGSLMRRAFWMAENAAVGLPNTSSTATEQVVFRLRGLTKLCNPQDHPDSILRYTGTPNVAQDMLTIVQAWDRWTSGLSRSPPEAKLGVQEHEEVSSTNGPTAELGQRRPQPPSTRGRLVYWGFSYGTILGATFATMFPEHVGRMVLDGVVNSDEWYFENSWINAVQDMDKVIDRFQLYCFQARERCHLYREGDKLGDLQQRFDSVLKSLADQPRVYAIKGTMPLYVTFSTVKALLFSATYVPAVFPLVAMVTDALYRGQDLSTFLPPIDLSPLCDSKARDMVIKPLDDGGTAVLCSDQRFKLNVTRAGLEKELQKMTDVSSFGDVAFTIASRCVGWDIDHVDPPSMDWKRFPMKDRDPVNTSFPILFVSNSRDPVTPLRSGLAQSRKFLDAGFIEQRGEGHCSSSMVSLCTMQKIQAYFSKGIVPDKPRFDDSASLERGGFAGNWTVCDVDQRPWGVPGPDNQSESKATAELDGLFRAGARLQGAFRNPAVFLPSYPHGFERLFQLTEEEAEELLASTVSRLTL